MVAKAEEKMEINLFEAGIERFVKRLTMLISIMSIDAFLVKNCGKEEPMLGSEITAEMERKGFTPEETIACLKMLRKMGIASSF